MHADGSLLAAGPRHNNQFKGLDLHGNSRNSRNDGSPQSHKICGRAAIPDDGRAAGGGGTHVCGRNYVVLRKSGFQLPF